MNDVGDASPAPSRLPSLRAGAMIALGCLALGAISAQELHFMARAHGTPVPFSVLLSSTMPRWIILAATLPWVFYLTVRTSAQPRWRRIGIQAVVFVGVSLLHAAIEAWMDGRAAPLIAALFPMSSRLLRAWYNTLPMTVALYAAVAVGAWAVCEARERQLRSVRASQLEMQLRSAQLDALRAKLQPHFFYNTLNGIAALVAAVEPQRAIDAIDRLSELLHASLRDDGRDEVTVYEEVRLAEQYLGLQEMRFGNRLAYASEVDDSASEQLVPVLLLQPIVENAVVHGLESGATAIRVRISARREGDELALRVENDGSAIDSSTSPGRGIGIAATQARLVTRYGDRASLRMVERAGGGVVVEIRLPCDGSVAPARASLAAAS